MRAALALVLLAGAAGAAPFDPGAPEGAVQTLARERAFERYDLPVARYGPGGSAAREVAGAVSWRAFRLQDPAATVAAIAESYAARAGAAGFETVFACETEACGGFDFRFGAAILPAPAMQLDVRDFAQVSLERADGVVVSVLVSALLGEVFVQTVTVQPAEPVAPVGPAPAPVQAEADEDTILPQDIREMLAILRRDGHVAIDGLEFATGGTAISPASEPKLDLLAQMLSQDAALSVIIVGHSDNEGGLDGNIDLSQRRAAAVEAALVARGVPSGQMEARGVGFLAPLISNATPEGRARNRRVELVLR